MEAILNAPDIRTRSGIRDRAMLHLGFATGLRYSIDWFIAQRGDISADTDDLSHGQGA